MIRLVNYKYDSKGEVVYLSKSSISEMKRIDKDKITHIWNKDSNPIEYVVKETPEEILSMPDIEECNKGIDWEQRRYEIAKDITAAIYTRPNVKCTLLNYNQIVAAADALVDSLKCEQEKNKTIYCGECDNFLYEDTYGYGVCGKSKDGCLCSDKCHLTNGKP